ncbi:MAG: hypothetical protein ABSA91_12410 [Acidimicrobiales bacterium]
MALGQHGKYQERFLSAMAAPELGHLEFVRIRSLRDAEAFLDAQRT